jgi:hypothetical protein
MTDTERLDQIEHNCLVLATTLGMCAGRAALAEGSTRLVDDMNAAAVALKQHGISAILVEAFNGGAKVGMEPNPDDGSSMPLGKGLRRNVDALMRKVA